MDVVHQDHLYLVRSNSIVHNTYTVIRINLFSKPTSIHGPVHKSDFNHSCSRIHFSCLPQAVTKELIIRLSHKVRYTSMMIDPVINKFSLDELKIHLHICDKLIVTLGIKDFFGDFVTFIMLTVYTGL